MKSRSVFFTRYILVLAGLCIVSCGCNPTDKDGEQAIQNQISKDAGGHMSLTSFRKIDGQKGEVTGTKIYGMEYEARVVFNDKCKWASGLMGSLPTFRVLPMPTGGMLDENAFIPGTIVSRGDHWKLNGSILFSKSENGWSVERVKIDSGTLVTP